MRYPILIKKISQKKVIAICPLLRELYAVGQDTDEALNLLTRKFMCFVHDPEAQFEIIPIEPSGKHCGKNRQLPG